MPEELTITERLIEQEEQQDDSAGYTATESPPASRPVNSWLPEVRKQLQAIESLPDGWDSYGAPTPNVSWLKGARSLIDCLNQVPCVPKPHVNPTPSGGVQFEWESGDRYFELEVLAERAATYLYCDDSARVEESGEVFEEDSLEAVVEYICRVAVAR